VIGCWTLQGYLEKARRRQDMFPAERVAAIFGNIAQIYEFSRSFLSDLQKQIITDEPELSQIGTCFLRHVRLSLCAGITTTARWILTKGLIAGVNFSRRKKLM